MGVVMTMVVMPRGESGRRSKHHQQQGCSKNFLHASNRTMLFAQPAAPKRRSTKAATPGPEGAAIFPKGVHSKVR